MINIFMENAIVKSHHYLLLRLDGSVTQLKDTAYNKETEMEDQSDQDLWENAKSWFNTMNMHSRNQMILTMYKLCLSTKDLSHEKITESVNNQWIEKFSKQVELTNRLSIENELLQKGHESTVQPLISKLKDIELNICNTMNSISLKITPSSNGKLGEDYIDQLLSRIPNTEFTNRTQSKGGGDFLLITGGIRIMIESKNWTNSSIKGNPKELDNFRKTAIEAKEEDDVDFAIMALHRVTDLKGKAMEIEMVHTKKGSLMLLFVTNLFNHPERILYAIDAGILLLNQQSQQSVDSDKFLYQVDNFMKGICSMELSIKERNRHIREMSLLVKNDTEQLMNLKLMLENILNSSNQLPIKDRVLNHCMELINLHGESNVSKIMLEKKCVDNKIPARYVREFGGIKVIKRLALEKLNLPSEITETSEVSEVSEESEGSEVSE